MHIISSASGRVTSGRRFSVPTAATGNIWSRPSVSASAPQCFSDYLTTCSEKCFDVAFLYIWRISLFIPHQTADHVQHVPTVLQRLLQHRLFCKLEKCVFHQPSTTFLGYVVSDQGTKMDPQNVALAVTNWPQPSTLKRIQSSMGFSAYYHSIVIVFF